MSNPLVGSTVQVRITVTDPDTGLPTDADVVLVIRAPDGTETSVTPDHLSDGVYGHFLTLSQAQWWTAIWTVTSGSLVTVIECQVCAGATVLVGA